MRILKKIAAVAALVALGTVMTGCELEFPHDRGLHRGEYERDRGEHDRGLHRGEHERERDRGYRQGEGRGGHDRGGDRGRERERDRRD